MKTDKLTIVYVSPKELIPADYNPRILTPKKEEQIRKSLLKFGFREPVVVNIHPTRKNTIIGGHQRVGIAVELGIKEIPTVQVSLPLAEEKELNLRLNDGGDWDFEKLKTGFEDSILTATGFEDVLTQDFGSGVLTKQTAKILREDGEQTKALKEGTLNISNVTIRVGAFKFTIPTAEYLVWKEKMHKEHGYSDKAVTAEIKKRLGFK